MPTTRWPLLNQWTLKPEIRDRFKSLGVYMRLNRYEPRRNGCLMFVHDSDMSQVLLSYDGLVAEQERQ